MTGSRSTPGGEGMRFLTVMKAGPLYYRGGHPLESKAWTPSISRARKMNSAEVSSFIAWADSVHNCIFEME